MRPILCVFFMLMNASVSLALSDFDRAVGYGANFASDGSFEARSESQLEKMQDEYRERKIQFELEIERATQAQRMKLYKEELRSTERDLSELKKYRALLGTNDQSLVSLTTLTVRIYKSHLTSSAIVPLLRKQSAEIRKLTETCQQSSGFDCPPPLTDGWGNDEIASMYRFLVHLASDRGTLGSKIDGSIKEDNLKIDILKKQITQLDLTTGASR